MKTILRRGLLFTIGMLSISIVYAFIQSDGFLLGFINSYSTLGLLILMLGIFILILDNGFFSVISYSFKKFWRTTSKLEDYIAEVEEDEGMDVLTKRYHTSWKYPFILAGTIAIIIGLMLSYLFFV